MKRNKILLILLPLIIVLLVLVGGFTYLKLNTTPKKIFTKAISKTFDEIKEKQKDYTTVKQSIELSANIESDDESIQQINKALETSKLTIDSEIDLKKIFVNENVKIAYDNENLINANLLVQDEKVYVAVKDWFDKYIELPEENYDFSEFSGTFGDVSTIDKTLLLETLKQELINEISKQSFSRETVTMNLNGQDTKITKSSLKLNKEQGSIFVKELLTNLKNNGNFQTALGGYKEEILNNMDEAINNLSDENVNSDSTITISIYTKGFLNKFVAIDLITGDGTEELGGMAFIKTSDAKYECYAYNNDGETREFIVRILGEEKNGQGTITILVPNDDEELEFVCKYQKKNNQTTYEITTEAEEVKFSISGSVITEETKYSGNAIITVEGPEYGKINLSCLYSLEYDAELQSVDVSNSVLLDEMTEEEQQELMTKFQESNLYKLVQSLPVLSYLNGMNENQATIQSDKESVVLDKYKVKYIIPENLQYINYSTDNYKSFSDDAYSMVYIWIESGNDELYLKGLENDSVFSSSLYSNQNITDTAEYKVGEKTFKYRGITYKYDTDDCLKIFFTYELDNNHTYVVEAEIINNSISLEQLNSFLDIEIEQNSQTSSADDIMVNGQTMSMEDYINSQLN